MPSVNDLLRKLPNVDRLMQNEILASDGIYRHEALEAVRDVLAEARAGLLGACAEAGEVGGPASGRDTDNDTDACAGAVPDDDELARRALGLATRRASRGVRKVINGTGVILHSNLGRACMSKAAARAAYQAASCYSTLEYDLDTGERGSRTACIEGCLRSLTGCESSLIVNNNAAAMLLILASVAKGGNVIISRGELVEIGGGFRVPEIITQSGCTLREVGTTNKTRLSDYQNAIDDDTRALLKVHTSNFTITGFTQSVTLDDIAKLGKPRGIPVIEDIGSGALIDMQRYGVNGEPLAAGSLRDGADVATFSGDKLLGGPQCGIILGRGEYISQMKKHPLYRALRVDKMTVAALEATLRVYAGLHTAERDIPVLAMLSMPGDALRSRADRLCEEITRRGGKAEVVETNSVAGGGAVPGAQLGSYAIALTGGKGAEEYERILRGQPTPIIGHIADDKLLLDVRTIFEEDFDYIIDVVSQVDMN